VPASRLIPVREDLDALQLAMMPVTAATAYALLHDYVAGASLRMLLEGTGDPARSPSWSASSTRRAAWSRLPPRPVRRPSFPSPTLIYRGISLRSFYIPGWLGDTPRERLEEIYGELAELVAQGVIGAEVEATYALDQFPVALAHAQRTARSGKVLFTPSAQAA
jgi:NADPH:quinone reductase-like Zn-dependent oxidoreductase